MAEDVLSVRSALGCHPRFASCAPAQLDRLSRVGTSLAVDPGYVFARAGRRSYELFLVFDGTATSAAGDAVTTLGPGDHFGTAGSDSSGWAAATVVATTRMHVIALDSRELDAVLALHPLAGAEG